MSHQTLVSVIVPTLNEEEYLGRLLDCLQRQTFQNIEVIVADANSTDRTVEIASMYRANVVKGGRVAVGRNNGAAAAHGDILLFLDADVQFGTAFVERSLTVFQKTKADMACCFFDTKHMTNHIATIYTLWNRSKKLRSKSKFPDGEGQCLWVKYHVFKKLGGFKKSLRMGEDVDLIHRAAQMGFRYVMLPQMFIPSSRRYEEMGAIRVFLATFVSGIAQIFGIKRGNRFSEKLYGGWGKYSRK